MSSRAKLVAMLIGLVGLALATAAVADEAKPIRVAGKLTKIVGKAITITTTEGTETKDTVVTCNDATKISRDARPNVLLKFKDLRVGQQVRAYCRKADNVALHVHIAKAPISNFGR
jgi:hypothetical protein